MARRAVVVLRLVCVSGTRSVTFVLVHHQVMLAAGTLVRPVLTTGAVGLAGYARAIFRICAKRKCKSYASFSIRRSR